MRDQLHQIEASIQKNVRHVCNGLVQNINRELQTLKEHASKLEEYENRQRVEQPGCTLQEHASKLEDYEDLQKQHKLTLDTCDSLRQQNVRLQTQVKELLAEQSVCKAKEIRQATPWSGKGSLWKLGSTNVSPNVQKLVEDHPDLQSAMINQFQDYKKLQNAHSILLGKLKEHQKVIERLRGSDLRSDAEDHDDNARLAHLHNIMSATGKLSKVPIISVSALSYSPPRTGRLSSATRAARPPGSDQSPANENAIVTHSSSPGGSDEVNEKERVTATLIKEEIAGPKTTRGVCSPHLISESEPEFISERPVKKRKVGIRKSEGVGNTMIKIEATVSDRAVYDDHQASIDLDAIHTPIIPLERRSMIDRATFPAVVDTANTNHSQRHSEPLPDLNHLQAREYALANKSVSFTSNVPETGSGNENMIVASSKSSRRQKDDAHPDETPQRSILQPTDPNTTLGNQSGFVDAQHDTNSTKYKRTRKGTNAAAVLVLQRHLRDKNVEELSINDFRLNPSMNRGFNQTMGITPSKISRHCLLDCSKPECCGSAFAMAIRKAGIASVEAIPESGKDHVISRYLGFSVSRLGDLSHSAYQQLLGEAIGKQFAEKYGKQQQVRADSPPGYWRVEFPSTQDRIADEHKANELEKAIVRQRRGEALRDGGLWMFRDE